MKLDKLKDAFDNSGNFIISGYDPYHFVKGEDMEALHNFLFDEDGYAKFSMSEIKTFIKENNFTPFSDAIKYYFKDI